MIKYLGFLFAVFAVAAVCGLLVAPPDESTLKGSGICAKCLLKETDVCQIVIQVNRGERTFNYYLVQNAVTKTLRDSLCKESKRVKAKGVIKDRNGKMEFTASRLKLLRDE